MPRNTRLELTWIGKDQRPRLEPRILLEDPDRSYHAPHRVSENDHFDNKLIFGDNLLALKALEAEYTGKIKCVCIDPPYNTGSAFTHYDDGVEHSLWLTMMRDRLELIWRLLSHDGSLWVFVDDNEVHYLKVLLDEIFGRGNFVANVVWQKRTSPDARATIGAAHDSILVIAKNIDTFKGVVHPLPLTEAQKQQYRNPDNDPLGPWVSTDFTGQVGHATPSQFYIIRTPSGQMFPPPPGRCWALNESTFYGLVDQGRVWFGVNGDARPRLKRYLSESRGVQAWTWWPNSEVGHNQESKKESINLFGDEKAFDTPKPERIIHRILTIATDPGDLVLDSFAGSGTTGAVAHKMGRRWIMVELGEHCHTHIIPRLKKVIDGEDPGGVTEATGWKGGGGFRYYRLAPSLLEKDRWGNWVISRQYNAAMLAEALCKHEGFTYAPSDDEARFWMHGHSTERDHIYVTTQTLTQDQLAFLSEAVGPERTLLICCMAWRGNVDVYANLTVKKIPTMLLGRCEWGRDDYSLSIASLPPAPEPEPAAQPATRNNGKQTPSLFDQPVTE